MGEVHETGYTDLFGTSNITFYERTEFVENIILQISKKIPVHDHQQVCDKATVKGPITT
jgi:hypothetical protein